MRTKLSRQTFPEQIAASLTDHIFMEDLKPGDLLPSTAQLADDFGVSVPVVREALKSLAGQGVIEIVNGKGAVIKPLDSASLEVFFQRAVQIDLDSVFEIMEIRQPLEVQSAFLAAQRRTDRDIAQLEQTVSAMRRSAGRLEAYAALDIDLHAQIASASKNMMLVRLVTSIRQSLSEAILTGLRSRNIKEELERVQGLHEAIVAAIRDADAPAAAQAMTAHFDDAVLAFTTLLNQRES